LASNQVPEIDCPGYIIREETALKNLLFLGKKGPLGDERFALSKTKIN
jgi:hypothetical protein